MVFKQTSRLFFALLWLLMLYYFIIANINLCVFIFGPNLRLTPQVKEKEQLPAFLWPTRSYRNVIKQLQNMFFIRLLENYCNCQIHP